MSVFLLLGAAFAQEPDRPSDAVGPLLEQYSRTVDFISRQIASAEGDDDTLINARAKLLNLRPSIDGSYSPVETRLNAINEALTKIGPAPEDAAAEDAIVKQERERLSKERGELLVLANRREELRTRIDSSIDQIAALRSAAFTQEITKRTPISAALFQELAVDARFTAQRVQRQVSAWFNRMLNQTPLRLGIVVALAALLAAGFAMLTSRVIRIEQGEHPSRFQLLSNALKRTIVPTLVLGIALAVFVVGLRAFELYPDNIARILNPIFLGGTSYFFITALISTIFSPDDKDSRLVPLTRYAASRVSLLLIILAAVQVLDYIVSNIARAVNAPLSVNIANSFIAAMLIGVVLMGLLLVRKDKDTKQRALPRWVRLPILLISLGIIAIALSGYVGLSRFIAQQIVVSGAILVTIYMGLTASKDIGEPGNLAETRYGQWLSARGNSTPERLDQYGLFISLLFSGLTLLVGLPALAMQWGSRFDDILTWGQQLFFGINIGSFSFSLGAVLFGIGVFVLVFMLTRWMQSWLSRQVLPRTRADIGVRNSITTGIGYAGIALAGLLGVNAAGFDLSSLAIVAGALSLGIGFGLQNVVSNFVSGLILLIERPIKVGDIIETGNHRGTIKKISVRATELETFHRMSVIVPNSELINSSVGNWTLKLKNGRIDIDVGVAYGTDYKKVREILLECASRQPEVMKDPAPFVNFMGFGDSSVNFQLRMHLRDWTKSPIIQSDVYFDICEEFDKHEIEIPFPQRDINIRNLDTAVENAVSRLMGKEPPKPKRKPKPKKQERMEIGEDETPPDGE